MKKIALLLSVLAAGTLAPAFASEFRASQMPLESSLTLEEMLSRSRVSVGASRESVLIELREPNLVIGSDVWIYTGFVAGNVFGAERFDTLVVAFKNDKVEVIRLAKEEQVRVAANRSGAGAAKVAKR
jgi:hypothetical protein